MIIFPAQARGLVHLATWPSKYRHTARGTHIRHTVCKRECSYTVHPSEPHLLSHVDCPICRRSKNFRDLLREAEAAGVQMVPPVPRTPPPAPVVHMRWDGPQRWDMYPIVCRRRGEPVYGKATYELAKVTCKMCRCTELYRNAAAAAVDLGLLRYATVMDGIEQEYVRVYFTGPIAAAGQKRPRRIVMLVRTELPWPPDPAPPEE